MTTIYQPIITGHDLEAAARDHLMLWSPDYLAEVGFQSGRARGDLAAFRSFLPALDLDKFAEDQVPSCVIVAPGLAEQPVKHGTKYRVRWQIGVGCVVSGQDRDNTFELTQLYAAAVRAAMIQHPSLGTDYIEGVVWLGERYDELGHDDARTLMAGSVTFGVDVPAAVDSRGGRPVPSGDPTAPVPAWGTVQQVTTELRREP